MIVAGSTPGVSYEVCVEPGAEWCSCPAYRFGRGKFCKHIRTLLLPPFPSAAASPEDIAMFQKATKYEAKGRTALIGPAGSGKSYTMLTLARALAGGGRIAAIDTEHGSLSKYADLFDFDVCEMDSFSPKNFLNALHAAEKCGHAVFCCDSLSHFWVGKDGALEFVDEASARHRDKMGGWKDFRPHEREMVDAMIASPCHVICTMRTKTDYHEVEENGKKKRVKVGLAPVQRDGMEYEFDLVGYMDDSNTLIVDKTRCPAYSGKALRKPAEKDFAAFVEWLHGAKRQEPQAAPPAQSQPANGNGSHPTGPIKITAAEWADLGKSAEKAGFDLKAVLDRHSVKRGSELTREQYNAALDEIAAFVQ